MSKKLKVPLSSLKFPLRIQFLVIALSLAVTTTVLGLSAFLTDTDIYQGTFRTVFRRQRHLLLRKRNFSGVPWQNQMTTCRRDASSYGRSLFRRPTGEAVSQGTSQPPSVFGSAKKLSCKASKYWSVFGFYAAIFGALLKSVGYRTLSKTLFPLKEMQLLTPRALVSPLAVKKIFGFIAVHSRVA